MTTIKTPTSADEMQNAQTQPDDAVIVKRTKFPKISLEPTFSDLQMVGESLRVIIRSWEFHWHRNVVGYAETTFNGSAQLVRPDGTIVHWNLVESWSHDDCGATTADARWYKASSNTDTNSFGWGTKEHESQYVSALLRFTGPNGAWTAMISSENCG
ncbi:hypothetical protein [Paraburkholderia sp. GAS42]|uniref:hypothetical protein n=1 Tax=Paraburkholderia sp. GAS42 TaxID=3035135 RepID=UPI003D2046A1